MKTISNSHCSVHKQIVLKHSHEQMAANPKVFTIRPLKKKYIDS